MRFRLTFSMDNDAFSVDPAAEVAMVLSRLSDHVFADPMVSGEPWSRNVFDSNGNLIGLAIVEESDAAP